MKPLDLHARVTRNLDLGGGYFLTSLDAPGIAAAASPGQFVMIGTPDPAELLLRRPFSICQTGRGSAGSTETGGQPGSPAAAGEPGDSGEIRILYRVVGRGTALFATTPPGGHLTVLGPLGVGFTMPAAGETPVLVAGGIGSAAFPFLVERMAASGTRPILIYGARSAADLPMLDWFRYRCDVQVTTEDGSEGEKGLVTAPLERLLEGARGGPDAGSGETAGIPHLYSCGPEPMMRAVARLAERYEVPSEAALETYMACGFGICLGCVVEMVRPEGEYGRYRRVCVEGPVFPTREIRW